MSELFNRLGIKESSAQDLNVASMVSAGALLSGINVSQIENSSIYRLSYDNINPELAARVVNAWADSFIEANIERRIDASSYARDFLVRTG
ncbi:MAG: hypothetical protein R3F37_04365 [Candidatus Competibacteraceae bacterium]